LKFRSVKKLEADDIVSFLGNNYENTVICSPDKDVLKQCSGVHYNYQKAEYVTTTTEDVQRFLWVQTLMGDSTDNIKGIPGVGVKTAENWVKNRDKNIEGFVLSKYIEYYKDSHTGIVEFYKNYLLVKLTKTESELSDIGVSIDDIPKDVCVLTRD
jgi:5'-3' exonuclease